MSKKIPPPIESAGIYVACDKDGCSYKIETTYELLETFINSNNCFD